MRRWLLAGGWGWAVAAVAQADCIDQAASRHGVHPQVLRAIGWHESRLRPEAFARNANGTVDIGAFQINSMHLRRLAAHGVDAAALRDGCTSAHVAAWHYAQQVRAFGNTWRAVGAYHSHTPARSAWYANAIASILERWQVAPPAPPPFDPATALAPGATAAGRPVASTSRRTPHHRSATAPPRGRPALAHGVVFDDDVDPVFRP